MKAYQVFARMTPERTHTLLVALREGAPVVYTQALAAASAFLRARPQFVLKQSPEKRAKLVRQALARFSTSLVAEEVLAAYFLQVKKPLLVEWLDAVGLAHEDGGLKDDTPPEPARPQLEQALASFRKPDDAEDRALLLEAFAAQSAIDWPALEEMLGIPRGWCKRRGAARAVSPRGGFASREARTESRQRNSEPADASPRSVS